MKGKSCHVLLADDDPLSRDFLKEALEGFGAVVSAVDDGAAAIKLLQKRTFDLVLTDLRMPRKDGMDVIRAAKEGCSDTSVVLVTAHGTVEVAVKALREGADDVLVKPVNPDQISLVLERMFKRNLLIAQNEYFRDDQGEPRCFVFESPAMKEIARLIEKVASSGSTVLITGESGTGKEIVANELHRKSDRSRSPMIKVNCAAIPETLIESELFGHEAGAFTGATGRRIGKFELAAGGTLFLDEIGEIPLPLQAKLLRVLEDGVVQRVGGNEPLKVDVRVIAATNKNLGKAVEKGHFREDLYYRLHIIPIHVPPLRERQEDIIPLAEHFLARQAARKGAVACSITPRAKSVLLGYPWPGNARELGNLMQRASLLSFPEPISSDLIQPWICHDSGQTIPALPRKTSKEKDPVQSLVGRTLREVEDMLILATLEREGGNRTRAAQVLGISPRTLYNRLNQMEKASRTG